jgi:branched-chain amino acid transport system ATP-binding protein
VSASNAVLLQARRLTKSYGKFVAVRDVNLTVRRGTVHSIIGPNGAGQTTLFHALTGIVPLTSGSVLIDGDDISRLPSHRRVQKGLGRSFQVTSLFPSLSVRENLRLAAQGRRPWAALQGWRMAEHFGDAFAKTDRLLARLKLAHAADRAASALSHGQQRRLEVGMAMAADAKIILLDEPTAGMGIDDIDDMKRLIRDLRNDCTVLLIEHNMSIVMGISDTITVMHLGEVLVEGAPDVVRNDVRVRRAYLGNLAS